MSCYTWWCSERHDALYVVGALDEVMELRGMKYHPIDMKRPSSGHTGISQSG